MNINKENSKEDINKEDKSNSNILSQDIQTDNRELTYDFFIPITDNTTSIHTQQNFNLDLIKKNNFYSKPSFDNEKSIENEISSEDILSKK